MDKRIEKIIGNNIRTLRENSSMTQEQLSAKMQIAGCNVTRSAIAKIEVGQRHIYPDELILIKEIFNVTFDQILKIK